MNNQWVKRGIFVLVVLIALNVIVFLAVVAGEAIEGVKGLF